MEFQESIATATWVYAYLTGAILVVLGVAGCIAKRQLTLMRRDSMRGLVKNLMEQWMSDRIVDARDTLDRMLKEGVHKAPDMGTQGDLLRQKLNELETEWNHLYRHLLRIPHYFEMVSTLVESESDALEKVLTLFRATIIYFYEMYQPWIKEQRKREDLHGLYVEFEKLYERARRTDKK